MHWLAAVAAKAFALGTVVSVIALVPHASAAVQPPIAPSAIQVNVGAAAVGRPVPDGFVGFSLEYRSAQDYFGTGPGQVNPLFVSLVGQLNPEQSPVLRIGGDTTDWTSWGTPGVATPVGIRYTIGPAWAQAAAAAAQALNARLILGINLEADSRTIAATEASSLLTGIGSPYVAGFELGNEPEVYGRLPWYLTPKGRPVLGRPRSYGFSAYLRDEASVSAALPPSVPLVGPASGSSVWLAGLHRYLVANPRVRLVTFHSYPLDQCFTPRSSPDYPTITNLLAPAASSGLAARLAPAVAVAAARGIPFRVDELNSVACGGTRGVSDTFASALWVLDTLFNLARVGVVGVNIHTFQNAIYQPFAFADVNGEWSAQVTPLYYGLLMFTRAAPPGSRLLATMFRAPATLRVWATKAPTGQLHVVLINDSHRSMAVSVRAPTTATTALGE